METKFKVKLEDLGQDLLHFITDENGVVIDAFGINKELYGGQ